MTGDRFQWLCHQSHKLYLLRMCELKYNVLTNFEYKMIKYLTKRYVSHCIECVFVCSWFKLSAHICICDKVGFVHKTTLLQNGGRLMNAPRAEKAREEKKRSQLRFIRLVSIGLNRCSCEICVYSNVVHGVNECRIRCCWWLTIIEKLSWENKLKRTQKQLDDYSTIRFHFRFI